MNQFFEFVSVDPGCGVVPVLVGPLSALMALLPAILVALFGLAVTMFKPSFIKRVLQVLWRQKIAVVLVVAAIWGLTYLWGTLVPSTGAVSVKEDAGDAEWILWRGGLTRQASVPSEEEPTKGNVNWSYFEGDVKTFYSSPAIVGNRAYITSARYEYFKDTGAICSIDADTGEEVWKYSADGYRATFSSPSISGKYLVVGEGLHLTKDARVVCIDIEASEEKRKGVKLWDYRTKSHVESSPCIYKDRAFIGAGDDGFYCFSLEPNEDGSPNILWHLEGKDFPDCETSPVAHEGRVYFGLGLGGQGVACVDTETGKVIWKTDTPYPVFSSPSLDNGKLYFGMGHGDFVNTAEAVASNLRVKLEAEGKSKEEIDQAVAHIKPIGEIWCLDAVTGEKKWDFKVGRTVLGAIAIDGDKLYFNSRDKHVYCLGTDGKLIQKWNAKEPIITSPAIGKEHVYVVTEGARLYGIKKQTMTSVWSVSLGNQPPFSSPALARGHIYVGTITNGFLSVGEPSTGEEEDDIYWEGHLGANGRSGWFDGSLIPPKGSFGRWSLPEEGPGEGAPENLLPVETPIAVYKKSIFVGINTGSDVGLAEFTLGEEVNAKPEQKNFYKTKLPVYISPAVNMYEVLCTEGRKGDSNRLFNSYDRDKGKLFFSRPIDAEASGEFIAGFDGMYIFDKKGILNRIQGMDGAEMWDNPAKVGTSIGAPSIDGYLIAVTNEESELLIIENDHGIEVLRKKINSKITTGPYLKTGRAWFGTEKGLMGVSAVQDEGDFIIECGPVTGRIVANTSRVACVTTSGEIVIADPAAGKELGRAKDVVGNFPPLLSSNSMLYNAKNAINRYDFSTGETTQWTRLRASWPGLMATPMVMIESHVFFATDKKGLICMKPKK